MTGRPRSFVTGWEAEGSISDALDAYGQILQLDYNFRDVRDRLEVLRAAEKDGS